MAGMTGESTGESTGDRTAQRRTILRLDRKSLADGARFLADADPRLGEWIDRVGPVGLRRQRNQFRTLCTSIISQQLGSKAARSIALRFYDLFERGMPRPESVLELETERLRGCGLSRAKVEFLRALARESLDGSLARVRLGALPDDQVIERLTVVKGIGVWTAEMFLIFALGRRDVFSVGDLALRNAVERVERRSLTPKQIERLAERRWSPYRSVASLYLWKVAHWGE